MRALPVVVLTVALTVLAAACGDEVRTTSGAQAPPSSAPAETTPDETTPEETGPLVRVEHVGGFLPVGAAFAEVPQLAVYGDGRAITHGPQILVFPGPALPNLLVHQLTPEQLERLERLAADAGLLPDPLDYGTPPVADAATTVVTLGFDGSTVVHRAPALGIGEDPRAETPTLGEDALTAREALTGFIDAASSLVSEADEGAPYRAESFAVLARAVPDDEPPADPGLEPDVVGWPVADVDLLSAQECTVTEGTTAGAVAAAFEDATQLTRFRQDGQVYEVFVRPLLPGEEECPDPGPVSP